MTKHSRYKRYLQCFTPHHHLPPLSSYNQTIEVQSYRVQRNTTIVIQNEFSEVLNASLLKILILALLGNFKLKEPQMDCVHMNSLTATIFSI